MIRLQKVLDKDRDLLWNINQKYLYEMTNFYDDPMDENGNYHYGHFDDYFTDPNRTAYLIFSDYTMAEFPIVPAYRRHHFGVAAAKLILSQHRGAWEIKYNEKNTGAKKLWNSVASPYEPELVRLNEEETVLIFTV